MNRGRVAKLGEIAGWLSFLCLVFEIGCEVADQERAKVERAVRTPEEP